MKYLVLDITNLLYRTFFAHDKESDITIAGLAMHTGLTVLNKYFRQHKPDKIVMCFDRSSWRKQYTLSEQCVSKKRYKGNRRQNMTPSQKQKYSQFLDHLRDFETMIRDHSTIVALAADKLEADDLVAGFVQYVVETQPMSEIVIISSDSDLVQLLKHDRVSIYSPINDKRIQVDNPEFSLFEKCLRGDTSDNIQSAYPRIKKTRIQKAYDNPYELANLMNEVWKGPDGTEYVVKQLFKENRLLIDLENQPEEIKQLIKDTINEEQQRKKSFSFFHFSKFLGKYELKKIAENSTQFVPMLSK